MFVKPLGCWAGGRGSHVAWLCLTRSLIASSPIWDTNGDIRTLHTGHPVIGTFTQTISHQPGPMNITWRLISPHSWVSSKIGLVSLTTNRSTVYSKLISIHKEVNSQECGEKLSLTPFPLARVPSHCDSYIDEWSPVPGVCWPGDHHANGGIYPGSPLAAHLSLAQLLSPHSAFLKYSGILKLSKVNPDTDRTA